MVRRQPVDGDYGSTRGGSDVGMALSVSVGIPLKFSWPVLRSEKYERAHGSGSEALAGRAHEDAD